VVALLLASACKDLVVPDYNNTSIDDLTNSPTPTKITQRRRDCSSGLA